MCISAANSVGAESVHIGRTSGWLDPGERLAIKLVVPAVQGVAILGVGGGRTAPLMAEISTNYRGIDYSPAMVEGSRGRFPDLCFHEMDARRQTFADDSFDLVTFSYNGIDSVDLAGRLEILRGAHRVLRPGGYFVVSALNRSGPAYDECWPDWRVFGDVASSPSGLLRAVARLVMGGINRLRDALAQRVGSDVAIGALSAHNFGLITLFTSVDAQLRDLDECGFRVEAIFEPAGRRVAIDGSESARAPWYHFVARKPNPCRTH